MPGVCLNCPALRTLPSDVDRLTVDDCDLNIACSAESALEARRQRELQSRHRLARCRELPYPRDVDGASLVNRVFPGKIHTREYRCHAAIGTIVRAVEHHAEALKE